MVTCCSLPSVSVKRRSANFASFSLINLRTSAGVIVRPPGKWIALGAGPAPGFGSAVCVPTAVPADQDLQAIRGSCQMHSCVARLAWHVMH